MSNGANLYWVVAHSRYSITLEDCYSNMQTVYEYPEFVKLGLKKVARRGSDLEKEAA